MLNSLKSSISYKYWFRYLRSSLLVSLFAGSGLFANDLSITVAKNDTISSIAQRYLQNPANWQQLLQANNLAANTNLKPGQILKVPANLLVQPLGVIKFKSANAQFRRNGDRNMRAANLNERLFEDDVLTSGSGKILVLLYNGAKLQLEPNTQITVKKANMSRDVSSIHLDKGRVYSMVNQLDKKASYRVFTPSSVAAVRGTEFLTEVDEHGNSVITCYKGSVSVMAQEQEVLVNAGEVTAVKMGQKPSAVRKILKAPQIIKVEEK